METTGHVAHHRFDRQDKNDNAGMHSGGLSASMQGKTAIDQGTGINQQMDFGSDLQRSPGERKLNFEKPSDLGVDSVALKNQTTDSTASNDQSKATDPTAKGVEEIRTSPIDQDMGKITLNDTEPSQKPNIANGEAVSTVAPTGSHNQFFEELVPPGPQSFESVPETFIATKFKDQPQDSNTDGRPLNLSSYTSSPNNPKQDPETYSERTPTDPEKQSSYTPSLKNPQHDPEDYDGSKPRDQEKQSGHTDQISSVTSGIAHKADVASKLGYGGDKEDAGTHGEGADESESYDDTEHSQCDQAREMQTNQGDSYTRKISSAAAAVTSTAISAKNVVASKLGYGEKCDNKHPIQEEESGKQQDSASKHEIGETAKEQGKGVSVGYFSEKLKPRDEDKALSELISEALHIQKIYPQKGEHEEKPMGKVTESEEVPKRLGSDDDKSSEKEQSNFVNVPTSGLLSLAGVCNSLKVMCRSDHLWERHMKQKWGRVIGPAAFREWQWHIATENDSRKLKQGKQNALLGFVSLLWPFSWFKSRVVCNKKSSSLPVNSTMFWYLALENGKFWFPAQVYNRENGHVGFMLSCYDAELCYDAHTDTFKARYPPHGRRAIAVENGVTWDRLRAPPVETPPHDLHVSDCLNELRPGDHIEIQWRRNKDFPYGWWYGVVGHMESCDGNESYCRCHDSADTVVLEFNQYSPGSRWRCSLINRKDHREEGNEADGFYGGLRKLKNKDEIAKWKCLWPDEVLE